jgi:hypothetical protein
VRGFSFEVGPLADRLDAIGVLCHLWKDIMRISRFLAPALAAFTLAGPLAVAAHATTTPPRVEHDFDTNFDGKIDLKIYDTNGDGIFEWPTGSKTLPGDLEVDVPVVMHGSVGITADDIAFDDVLTTFPGAPLSSLTLTARGDFGSVFVSGQTNIVATGKVTATAPGIVSFDSAPDPDDFHASTVTAGSSITLTSLQDTPYIYDFNYDPNESTVPGEVFKAPTINMYDKGTDSGIETYGAELEAKVINLEATNSKSDGNFDVNNTVLTTNPATTGYTSPGNILLEGEQFSDLYESTVDSGYGVTFKTFAANAPFCIRGGSVTAKGGAGTISIGGVRGGVLLSTDEVPVITGKLSGKNIHPSDEC